MAQQVSLNHDSGTLRYNQVDYGTELEGIVMRPMSQVSADRILDFYWGWTCLGRGDPYDSTMEEIKIH